MSERLIHILSVESRETMGNVFKMPHKNMF